jgi:tetratricopeptide (TPR) repeat protein
MRSVLLGVAVLGGWLVANGAVRAGVHFAMDGETLPRIDWVEREVGYLRSIPAPLPEGQGGKVEIDRRRLDFDHRFAELEAKARDGLLATIDRIDLGACYIRKARYADAVRVLKDGDQEHFLILLNLATAYHNQGALTEAIACQEKALRDWPALYPGWSTGSWIWYRRAESLYLKLLRLRQQEKQREETGRTTGPRNQAVDPLFARVRFVGPSGRYEPGPFPRLWEELPGDAPQLVLQLVLWQPADDRLYWLYGELLNAGDQQEAAYKVFDEIVWKRNRTDLTELVDHRLTLRRTLEDRKPWTLEWTVAFLTAVRPRGGLEPPGIGAAATETGPALWWYFDWRKKNQTQPVAPPPEPDPGANLPANWLPDLRTVVVSFVAGALVAVLVGLQWSEWRRRAQAEPPNLDNVAGETPAPRPDAAPFAAADQAAGDATDVVPESTHTAENR